MNKITALLLLLLGISAQAHEVELATLIGFPNPAMPFVQEVLKAKVPVVPGDNLRDYTTATVYAAWRNGVESAMAVQVMSDDGSASTSDVALGIAKAGVSAAVVLAPIGPRSEELCALMASRPEVAYLLPIGSEGMVEDPAPFPSCKSPNILFVAGLNQSLDDLAVNQTRSPLIRVSAPYRNLTAPVEPGRKMIFSATAMSMGFVAGKMARLARKTPSLQGAELIDAFLAGETVYLPALEGKVGLPRALVNVNY